MVSVRSFEALPCGSVHLVTLTDETGCAAEFLSLGATVRAVRVPDREGRPTDVVLGYETAGEYLALRVVIGEGKGRNWWCVMFPNMCFSDTVFEVVEDEAKENLYQVMTLHEYRKMIESPDKEVRFRYLPF